MNEVQSAPGADATVAPEPAHAAAPVSAPPPAPPAPAEEAPAVEERVEPTVRDHAARLELEPWQIATIVARMNGEHDADGKRVFAKGVDLNTRLTDTDFDAALKTALHGRI